MMTPLFTLLMIDWFKLMFFSKYGNNQSHNFQIAIQMILHNQGKLKHKIEFM